MQPLASIRVAQFGSEIWQVRFGGPGHKSGPAGISATPTGPIVKKVGMTFIIIRDVERHFSLRMSALCWAALSDVKLQKYENL